MDQNVGTLKLVVLVSVPVIRLSFWFHLGSMRMMQCTHLDASRFLLFRGCR